MSRTLAILISLLAIGGCGGNEGSTPVERDGDPSVSASGSVAGSKEGSTDGPATAATQWFVDITDDSGVDFVRHSHASSELRMWEIMGGGAAVFDVEGDGDLDLYFTQAADEGGNRLYVRGADGRYTDGTARSGLGDAGDGNGVATGDVDNDGDVDVFVANTEVSWLYRNRGDGTFERDAEGLVEGWASSTAFVDYDGDGWLDLYVCRYVHFDPEKVCRLPSGVRDYCGPREYPPVPDVLLRNRGDGTFEDVSERAGIAAGRAAGLGVACADLDGDGRIDIYVANDGYANHLWLGQPDGSFKDGALIAGAAVNLMGDAEAGMGVVAADFDRDGLLDLFMTHLSRESNTLYRNTGAGLFDDASISMGLAESSIPYTGFGTVAFDANLDGALDLFVGNGRVSIDEVIDGALPDGAMRPYAEPNQFFLNLGDSAFRQMTDEVVDLCGPVEVTRAVATGDLDADGDLDLVLVNLDGRARVYRNDTPRAGTWLAVRVLERGRAALGAEVRVSVGGRRFVATVGGGDSYQSSSDPTLMFGLGTATAIDGIEVRWADGSGETFDGMTSASVVTLERGAGRSHS